MYKLTSTDHAGLIKKKVKKFRKFNFLTDFHIVCDNGTVSIHKMIILQRIPYLAKLLCDICDFHSETTLMVPDVTKEDLEREVKTLY